MFDISNHTTFQNEKQNERTALLDNQSIILDFALFDQKSEQKIMFMFEQTGLGLKVFVGISLLIMETIYCFVWFGMKSLEWILKNALSPINCLVG